MYIYAYINACLCVNMHICVYSYVSTYRVPVDLYIYETHCNTQICIYMHLSMRVHSSLPVDTTPPPSDVRVCVCVRARARVYMCVVCLVHDVCMYMCICE